MSALSNKDVEKDLRYLNLLSKQYPNTRKASTEIINLQAILNLPKGTEHFISDIHGEYESFTHNLKNASGVIKRKINDIFGNTLMEWEKNALATLVYYPEEKLDIVKKEEKHLDEWYKITLFRLIELCRVVSSKYTRSKVRKALPPDFSYIIEELLHENGEISNKEKYYNEIINTLIKINTVSDFIIEICKVIQRLAVDRLHILGDIYDRGPGAEIIIDKLMKHHSIDIEWGNHDIVWMGAASGSLALIANSVRIALRYGNLKTLEDGYGINLLPLASYALETYKDDPCSSFIPIDVEKAISPHDIGMIAKMHKAITIMQFKLEGAIIENHKEFNMEDRKLLHRMDLENKTITIDGNVYSLNDTFFPTLDKQDPYKLSKEEKNVINRLSQSYKNSEKLQAHVKFLYNKGSLYKIYNSNLLFHGCIPLNQDGSLKEVNILNKKLKGRALMDEFDSAARSAYFLKEGKNKTYYGDIMWYLWCGEDSSLFGKKKMTTFERYFINDKKTHHEEKLPYYKYREDEGIVLNILSEFGLNEKSHIINGHVPVKTKDGELPIKANGKLLAIDGGFCKAYQPQTGIAGYTLIYNSYGLLLVSQEPFEGLSSALEQDKDIIFSSKILEMVEKRKTVGDTDIGTELRSQIKELTKLLYCYRNGLIKEN